MKGRGRRKEGRKKEMEAEGTGNREKARVKDRLMERLEEGRCLDSERERR